MKRMTSGDRQLYRAILCNVRYCEKRLSESKNPASETMNQRWLDWFEGYRDGFRAAYRNFTPWQGKPRTYTEPNPRPDEVK